MFENLNDVMKRLSLLKNMSDGYDQFNTELNAIAEMLKLFKIEWCFIEDKENDKWVAVLK